MNLQEKQVVFLVGDAQITKPQRVADDLRTCRDECKRTDTENKVAEPSHQQVNCITADNEGDDADDERHDRRTK